MLALGHFGYQFFNDHIYHWASFGADEKNSFFCTKATAEMSIMVIAAQNTIARNIVRSIMNYLRFLSALSLHQKPFCSREYNTVLHSSGAFPYPHVIIFLLSDHNSRCREHTGICNISSTNRIKRQKYQKRWQCIENASPTWQRCRACCNCDEKNHRKRKQTCIADYHGEWSLFEKAEKTISRFIVSSELDVLYDDYWNTAYWRFL